MRCKGAVDNLRGRNYQGTACQAYQISYTVGNGVGAFSEVKAKTRVA